MTARQGTDKRREGVADSMTRGTASGRLRDDASCRWGVTPDREDSTLL